MPSKSLEDVFNQIAQLPQCETAYLGDGVAGIANLHNGLVVARRFATCLASDPQAPAVRTLQSLQVSFSPLGTNEQGQIERAHANLSVDGAEKLLRVWTAQAKDLGLA